MEALLLLNDISCRKRTKIIIKTRASKSNRLRSLIERISHSLLPVCINAFECSSCSVLMMLQSWTYSSFIVNKYKHWSNVKNLCSKSVEKFRYDELMPIERAKSAVGSADEAVVTNLRRKQPICGYHFKQRLGKWMPSLYKVNLSKY